MSRDEFASITYSVQKKYMLELIDLVRGIKTTPGSVTLVFESKKFLEGEATVSNEEIMDRILKLEREIYKEVLKDVEGSSDELVAVAKRFGNRLLIKGIIALRTTDNLSKGTRWCIFAIRSVNMRYSSVGPFELTEEEIEIVHEISEKFDLPSYNKLRKYNLLQR